MQSSRQQILIENVKKLLEIEDTESLRALLIDAGVVKGTENSLEEIEHLEMLIAQDFSDHYNRFLHYLPDDLRDFFEACKILWDIENIKLAMCYLWDGRHPNDCIRLVGPFSRLDPRSLESLSKSKSAQEMLRNAVPLLPAEYSSKIDPGMPGSINDLEFSLDVAAFEYLKEKSEEIGTQGSVLAWESLAIGYELENLVTLARLRYSGSPLKDSKLHLFPVQAKLNTSEVERLSETENYHTFLEVLRDTYYGEFIPSGQVDPLRLKNLLRKELHGLRSEEMRLEITRELIASFLVELEQKYDTIRKATFLASLKATDEE